MYELHIANKNYSSWSLRPWLLMTALRIPFTEVVHPFQGANNAGIFGHFSPSGRVPVLYDGALAVWDSLAIVEYLAEIHAGVWPEDYQAKTWARCATAEMHAGFSALRNICPMNCGIRVTLNPVPAALTEELVRLDALWQEGLRQFGGPFLAGEEFSAVDAFYAPVVMRIQTYGLPLSPAAQEWYRTMLALPSLQDWYRQALAEAWRDESHEAESRQYGEITQDLRRA
ncbi:glutathione S-transferase family protein [Martelella alba]|uniref:Glutathione S-transferase family protein n=1 Tax=Martelella alba TaxID=2590451 RepID=A0ABY2SNA6_9HYPH|nr:glutathione S-transferase family protein [Martelella alba]TKI07426.1 glutathione S-transferase family protein [Martelella alba]